MHSRPLADRHRDPRPNDTKRGRQIVPKQSQRSRRWRPLAALRERGRTYPLRLPYFANRTSAFFFLPDLAIDEIADIVVILFLFLFLFLEERIVGGFNLDIIVRHDHDLVLAGIGFLK